LQQGVKATREAFEGDWEGWTLLSAAPGDAFEHGFDWLNSRDGLFGKGESQGDGSEQLSVDIDGAAAHPLENTRFGQGSAAQTGEDDGLPWSEIPEDSEDLDLEIFDMITLEDSLADSSKSRVDILNWEEILTRRERE
jgi:hypothetical protein